MSIYKIVFIMVKVSHITHMQNKIKLF